MRGIIAQLLAEKSAGGDDQALSAELCAVLQANCSRYVTLHTEKRYAVQVLCTSGCVVSALPVFFGHAQGITHEASHKTVDGFALLFCMHVWFTNAFNESANEVAAVVNGIASLVAVGCVVSRYE